MTRIEPDSHKITRTGLGEGKFLRSTVLRAIDETRRDWDEADDPPLDSEVSFRDLAYAQGYRQACNDLRARFQPTEGENGHE